MSRHLFIRPGCSSARAAYLQPAIRSAAYDYRLGHNPCHGASAVPKCPRALPVTAGSDGGSRGRRLRVDAHDSSDPRHVAAAVPWCLYGSDGHGAARVEDMADRARNGPLPEPNRVCVICFGDIERIVVTREAASVGNGSFYISNQRINRGPLFRQR